MSESWRASHRKAWEEDERHFAELRKRERRERIATAVLAGMHASPKVFTVNGQPFDTAKDNCAPHYALIAVVQADALIAELDK